MLSFRLFGAEARLGRESTVSITVLATIRAMDDTVRTVVLCAANSCSVRARAGCKTRSLRAPDFDDVCPGKENSKAGETEASQ
jgi:hypothetical protein